MGERVAMGNNAMSRQRQRAIHAQRRPAPLTPDKVEQWFRDDLQRRRDEERQWRAVWADDQERGQ